MAVKIKNPNDILDYRRDWSWLSPDYIVYSSWFMNEGSTLIIDNDTEFTAYETVVWVSGGTDLEIVTLTNRVVTNLGRQLDYSFTIKLINNNSGVIMSHLPVTLDGNADTLLSLSSQTIGVDAQSEKKFLAGPTSGADAVPTFREIAITDVPTLNQNTTGTAGGLSSTLAVASGGTGQTTAQLAINALTAVSSATNEYVLTKDTATGNAVFKEAAAGSGDVATDAIWDAAGDLAVGTGANTAAKSNIGSEQVVARIGAANVAGVSMAEQTVLARLTGASIDDVAIGIADNNIVQIDGADIADDEYARFTASGLESRSKSEVATDLKDQFPQAITDNHVVTIDQADAATGEYAKFTANGIESKSASEMKTDLSFATSTTVTELSALTQAQYNALDPVVATTLYIITDTQKIMFGSIEVGRV